MSTNDEDGWAERAKVNEAKRIAFDKRWKPLIVVVAILSLSAVIVLKLTGVIPTARTDDKERCVERGIAYFKEIGSWPYLSNGRLAEPEAKERCARTVTAFPE